MSLLKRKPWWLKLITKSYQWVTFYPNIYSPDEYLKIDSPEKLPVYNHEMIHIHQQLAYGKWKWLYKYLTSPKFRLEQESEAISNEMKFYPSNEAEAVARIYARDLTTTAYWHAASNDVEAYDMIMKEYRKFNE